MTRITVQDIAKKLGVSGSTVSRALHDDPRISKKVIQEVKRTAAQMGYIPNVGASNLRMGKTRLIGLIVRDIRDGFCLEVIPGIEAVCAANEYSLLVCNAAGDFQREQSYLRTLLERRVDGIILITPVTSIVNPYLRYRQSVPLVLVDIDIAGAPMCAVSMDHKLGGYISTRHLLDLGHRNIAFLSGPISLSSSLRCIEGYKRAMIEAGIPEEEQVILLTEKTGIADGITGMREINNIAPRPTAIATFSDLMAAGALEAARQIGLAVPEDLSIIGYDDIPLSSLLTPPLSTVKQNNTDLGSIAMDLLFDEIRNESHEHRQIQIPPDLILRQSTAPPKAAEKTT